MRIRKVLLLVIVLAVIDAAAVGGVLAYGTWRGWLSLGKPAAQADKEGDHHPHGSADRVTLSPQARANLRLEVKPLHLETYSRRITVPGMVVERQGRSDRGVTSPLAGVVRRIAAVPGETVRPGDELFTLRLNSEPLQTSQTELFKNTRELLITQEQKQRLEAVKNAVPEARLLELDYQMRRIAATLQAVRYDLAARGLSPQQIQGIAEGKFVTEITIRVPGREADSPWVASARGASSEPQTLENPTVYEVEELKVQVGEQVQGGQTLCTLADHQALFLEGRVFKQEIPLLEHTAQKGWLVRAELPEGQSNDWLAWRSDLPALALSRLIDPNALFPLLPDDLVTIRFLSNRVDPASQTVPVYAPLANQYREYTEGGKTYRIWRFRPGQRVRLFVPVEQFPDVFVLPAAAVVNEGPEAYVFRANGDSFDRKPVHVLYEDRQHVVIANDGSVNVGNYVAFNGAAQLNRVLKAKAAGGGGHGHEGHNH